MFLELLSAETPELRIFVNFNNVKFFYGPRDRGWSTLHLIVGESLDVLHTSQEIVEMLREGVR